MLTSDFDYNLPLELIAQQPVEPRDSSRLMIVNRVNHEIKHEHFYDIVNYLCAGDLLVWNNSKVFKARLYGELMLNDAADGLEEKFKPTERILPRTMVEIFLVRPTENKYVWKVLAKPGRKLRLGMKVKFADLSSAVSSGGADLSAEAAVAAKADDFVGEVMLKEKDGTWLLQFADDDATVRTKANKYGVVPTPPYIEELKIKSKDLSERYQTVYARHEGSVAAPTAGFHFTPELIERLKAKGVQFAEVTLHVGLGTFLPVKSDTLEEHAMHGEWVELTAKNADLINAAKAEGRRVVAVGTTTVRVLEGAYRMCHPEPTVMLSEAKHLSVLDSSPSVKRIQNDKCVAVFTGDINIFITPGYKFQIVDALITNFHLPKSTLLMLVSAFADAGLAGRSPAGKAGRLSDGREFMLECYQEAIKNNYRFYSFGDAMMLI